MSQGSWKKKAMKNKGKKRVVSREKLEKSGMNSGKKWWREKKEDAERSGERIK